MQSKEQIKKGGFRGSQDLESKSSKELLFVVMGLWFCLGPSVTISCLRRRLKGSLHFYVKARVYVFILKPVNDTVSKLV